MSTRAKLFANVKKRRAEYLAISADYDAELAAAHNAGDRTAVALMHLKRARGIGPAMLQALKRYQEAVAALAEAVP